MPKIVRTLLSPALWSCDPEMLSMNCISIKSLHFVGMQAPLSRLHITLILSWLLNYMYKM